MYLGKRCFGENPSILANWLYLGKRGLYEQRWLCFDKLVVIGQHGFIWTNWFYFGNLFYLGKLVLYEQKWFYLGKGGRIWEKVIVFVKMVLFGQI